MASGIVACLIACMITLIAADSPISPLTSYIGTSLQGCRKQCEKRPSCRSVLYKQRATYCKLFDVTFSVKEVVIIQKSGVVYRDSRNWPELNRTRDCYGTPCTSGEVCEDSCIVSECPSPPLLTCGSVSGNRRQIESKLRYRCLNMNKKEAFAECQSNGKWTAIDIECDTPEFKCYGLNTYMHVDMSYSVYASLLDSFVNTSVSLEKCLSVCNASTDFCVGVNFNSDNGTCISTYTQTGLNTQSTPTGLPGWTFYFKKMPVFYSIENYKEKYQFNFKQAEDHCKSLNTTLPSLKDVQMAYDLGFSLCRCVWVTEGFSVLALHYVYPLCFDNSESGVFECYRNMNDAMCKNPRFHFLR